MQVEKGSLSIHSENIFPIIKKWLYSDHDIFIRELVSNATDAITKLKKLKSLGEADYPEGTAFSVQVVLDEEAKTLKFIDNGIGMTGEEVKKYINQIAFSGAEDFLSKYKEGSGEDQIIGHFGLGFYSAFMVADKVEIQTLSFQEGAAPVHWVCEGGTEFSMADGDRTGRGTEITLHLGEDGKDFLTEWSVRKTLEKYCSFMPVEIYLTSIRAEKEKEERRVKAAAEKAEQAAKEDAGAEAVEPEIQEMEPVDIPKAINDTKPLYLKKPSECTDEEYRAFYHKTFVDFKEPLFWIHLNMDYPFNLKGILYFPKLGNQFDTLEGQIKLYNSQVFIADNIKEVIPEFLLLLKGVVDCPDLPLNVSRSFLQNDGFVQKISSHISKKVADKLNSLYKTDKENYGKFWDDINPFIKFGCLKDEKFYEKVKDIILYKDIYGKYLTLPEYLEENREKHADKVFFTSDEQQQSQYIKMFKEHDMDAVLLPHAIDQPFISHMEMKEEKVKFSRIDTDLTDLMKDVDESTAEALKESQEVLEKLFRAALGKEQLTVQVENLKSDKTSAIVILPEESRRMQEMGAMYGFMGMDFGQMQGGETLLLNHKNKLVRHILAHQEDADGAKLFCEQVYDLAMISHKPLDPEAMSRFIERSNQILEKLV
ncbi:molecular chaperone HtpG [Anaerotalea alkaliphila]|uniref:Molecular chaperone HtpG n=1 Tax=Anaerotalea alkaliphila TaxID=2662126 RepID=A0A7X5HXA0_9FIRM|nr:molecular chaperone HtpG [Anaerotalea alkaliphila]NDL68332.1 molecular chaperone HtpG [Anaerotalea alkaliphila]